MTESDKKKAIAEGKNYTGIINDEAHQKDILIQNIGDSDAMKKWNYIITPHSPERRWKDYRMSA
jgi:hypothetical protein